MKQKVTEETWFVFSKPEIQKIVEKYWQKQDTNWQDSAPFA